MRSSVHAVGDRVSRNVRCLTKLIFDFKGPQTFFCFFLKQPSRNQSAGLFSKGKKPTKGLWTCSANDVDRE